MANEKRYLHQHQPLGNIHTNGLIGDVITDGIDSLGSDCVFIRRDLEAPEDIDYIWGELKKKTYSMGYGMRMLQGDAAAFTGPYNFSKFGFLNIEGEQKFYISIREFYQRITGYLNVTETDIINGADPSGYSETNILETHPSIGDLIWLPWQNKLYELTFIDKLSNVLFQKYTVWEITAKLYQADHRDNVDITGSENQGLVPDSLDISTAVEEVKDIQDTERLTDADIDPTQTGNDSYDEPTKPLNKNIILASEDVVDPNKTSDIFGSFLN